MEKINLFNKRKKEFLIEVLNIGLKIKFKKDLNNKKRINVIYFLFI